MQPTMKLRMLKVMSPRRGQPFVTDNYGNSYIWQQWWEQPPLTPLGVPQPTGVWRDIPIEVENA